MTYARAAVLFVGLLAPSERATSQPSPRWIPDGKTFLFINQFEAYTAFNQIVIGLDGPDPNPKIACQPSRNTFGHNQYATYSDSAVVVNSTLQMAFFSNRRVRLYIEGCTPQADSKGKIVAVKVEP
jgi:hypothetical protein